MAIDQRYTKWVKKEGKKGYVIDTRTGKKVTGNVRLVADTTKGKAGEVQKYKRGVGKGVRAMAAGAGVQPGKKPGKPAPSAGGRVTVRKDAVKPDTKKDEVKKPKDKVNTAAARDRAMAGRAGLTSRRAGSRTATSATVSSAKATPRPSAKPAASQGNGSPAARIRAAVINAVSGAGGGRRPASANGWSGFAVQPAQRPSTKAKPVSSAAAAKAEAARKARAKAAAKAQAKWQSGR